MTLLEDEEREEYVVSNPIERLAERHKGYCGLGRTIVAAGFCLSTGILAAYFFLDNPSRRSQYIMSATVVAASLASCAGLELLEFWKRRYRSTAKRRDECLDILERVRMGYQDPPLSKLEEAVHAGYVDPEEANLARIGGKRRRSQDQNTLDTGYDLEGYDGWLSSDEQSE